jgi:diguanylate cyclase (GGDEF)-like protein
MGLQGGAGAADLFGVREQPEALRAALDQALATVRELERERDHYRAELARLQEQAGADPLTGLPDRRGLADRVEAAIREARAGNGAVAVLFVDLDQVPSVNAYWGHATGDQLICTVADRLRGRLRRRDVLARIGGHEFLLALLDPDPDAAAQQARRIAAELLDLVRRPVTLSGTEVPVGARVGLSVFPHDGADFGALLRAAAHDRYERRVTPATGSGG